MHCVLPSINIVFWCIYKIIILFIYQIFSVPQPDYASPGETYYVSLMRENLQVRMGDTVYVLRAFKSPPTPELVTTSPISGTGKSPKPEEQTSFNQGGIKHKMMSPLKGPSQEASTLTKGVKNIIINVVKPNFISEFSSVKLKLKFFIIIYFLRITLPTNLWRTPKPLLRTWTFSEWSAYGLTKKAKDSLSDTIISGLMKHFMNQPGNFSAMKCFGCLYMRFCPWIPYGSNVGFWICLHFVKADLEVP